MDEVGEVEGVVVATRDAEVDEVPLADTELETEGPTTETEMSSRA